MFIGVVVLLSFLLLTEVFRSLLIPAVAALMNLPTAGKVVTPEAEQRGRFGRKASGISLDEAEFVLELVELVRSVIAVPATGV